MDTMLTTLAPPAAVLARSAVAAADGESHGAREIEHEGFGEDLGLPLVAATGEVGACVVDEDVELADRSISVSMEAGSRHLTLLVGEAGEVGVVVGG